MQRQQRYDGQADYEYAREKASVWMKLRTRMADSIGYILKYGGTAALTIATITGGDASGFMNQVNVCEMEPVCE